VWLNLLGFALMLGDLRAADDDSSVRVSPPQFIASVWL
jgi:hypothetical protein